MHVLFKGEITKPPTYLQHFKGTNLESINPWRGGKRGENNHNSTEHAHFIPICYNNFEYIPHAFNKLIDFIQ